jgi:hypothetical protein
VDATTYLMVVLGVAVSVVLPVLVGLVRQEFPSTAGIGLPLWVRKYTILLVFSALTGLVVLAFYASSNPTVRLGWDGAFLLGFGWESAIEKLTKKSPTEL